MIDIETALMVIAYYYLIRKNTSNFKENAINYKRNESPFVI